jgi:predicted nucleotidyltransferase
MTTVLSREQIEDLGEIQAIANRFDAELVIIGAVALLCFLKDLGRFTRDIDLVIALDLDRFPEFVKMLISRGWIAQSRLEHRWRSKSGSVVDLLPAGPKLRAEKRIVWPGSQFEMNLVGFQHVFDRAVPVEFGSGGQFKVAPLPVIALLKVAAYLDDRYRRAKDLEDLKTLFYRYEKDSDRIFCDEVFRAELEDIEYASAFLLGMDIGAIATTEDLDSLRKFLDQFEATKAFADTDDPSSREARFQKEILAFQKGLLVTRTAMRRTRFI